MNVFFIHFVCKGKRSPWFQDDKYKVIENYLVCWGLEQDQGLVQNCWEYLMAQLTDRRSLVVPKDYFSLYCIPPHPILYFTALFIPLLSHPITDPWPIFHIKGREGWFPELGSALPLWVAWVLELVFAQLLESTDFLLRTYLSPSFCSPP